MASLFLKFLPSFDSMVTGLTPVMLCESQAIITQVGNWQIGLLLCLSLIGLLIELDCIKYKMNMYPL